MPKSPAAVMWAEQFHAEPFALQHFGSWKCCSLGRPYSEFIATVLRQVADGSTSKAILTLVNGQTIIVRKKTV